MLLSMFKSLFVMVRGVTEDADRTHMAARTNERRVIDNSDENDSTRAKLSEVKYRSWLIPGYPTRIWCNVGMRLHNFRKSFLSIGTCPSMQDTVITGGLKVCVPCDDWRASPSEASVCASIVSESPTSGCEGSWVIRLITQACHAAADISTDSRELDFLSWMTTVSFNALSTP